MSEIRPIDAQKFVAGATEQFDKLLIGEPEAKLGCLVAMVSGLNVVLVGPPGGGKTTLAENMHRVIDGIDDENVAVVPPQSDLMPMQLIGGTVEVSRAHVSEEGEQEENVRTTVDAILKPTTQVIFANEINRVSPYAVNAVLEVMEQGKLITTSGIKQLDDLEFQVSTMNPSERREATFDMTSAAASRHAIGAVLGHDRASREDITSQVLGGWVPRFDLEKVVDLGDLHAMRRVALEEIAIPDSLNAKTTKQVMKVADQLRGEDIDEADARLAKHVSMIARTLATFGGEQAVTEENLHQAFRFVLTARLGILATGSTQDKVKQLIG